MSGVNCGEATGGREFPNQSSLRRSLGWFLNDAIFSDLALHGNTKWRPRQLASLALLWIFSDKQTLTEAFDDARDWSLSLFGGAAHKTFQGMALALVTWTPRWMPLLWNRLHQLMEQVGERNWRIGRWLPLAVDGSRGDLARTKALERRFCAKNHGHGKTARYRKKKTKGLRRRRNQQAIVQPQRPQIWITLLWHMGLRMPWSWRLGASDSSERQHLSEMLKGQTFPKNTLFVGDAGFVGFDFWQSIVDAGHDLLVRVGGNVRLLRKQGRVNRARDLVHCWPQSARRQGRPPLRLRLFTLRDGDQLIYLVTSVLDAQSLSLDTARELYRQRWGIELQFRSLKQTFGRGKLRSHNPDRALAEMNWSLLGLSVIQLWALREQIRVDQSPEQLSVIAAIRAVRKSLTQLYDPRASTTTFRLRLRHATLDTYQRQSSKRARYRPNFGCIPSCKPPLIIPLSQLQHRQIHTHHLHHPKSFAA